MPVNLAAIGVSGIYAAESELAATESNITNASNPNYSAESVNLAARAGYGGDGVGVDVLGTQRAQAPFIDDAIYSALSGQSYNQAFTQATTLAQNFISPTSGVDLSQSLQGMFNSFASLAATPTDPSVRTAAISAAANFAQTASTLSGNLQQTASDQLAQLSSLVAQVNDITQQIAGLNGQIQSAQANSGGAAALMDQRDALIGELAGLIGAQADAAGNVNVSGVPLVSGSSALTLSTTGSGANVGLQVTLAQGAIALQPAQAGGTIGGVINGAASILQAQTDLNSFAASVAGAINTVHQAGCGLDGTTGNALFLIPGAAGGPIQLNPAITVQNLAASSTAAGVPGDGSNATAIAGLANMTGIDPAFAGITAAQAFTQITSQFGSTVATATSNQQQASTTLQSLQQLKGSITGVSLNDQLSHLVEYQNALEAAGRAVQVANDLTTFLIQELNQ